MKYVDEFRDPRQAQALLARIRTVADDIYLGGQRPLQIMEFCGGHTHTIFRYGIEQLLPGNIELIHGPGCPVCILPREAVDSCISLAQQQGVILTSFGDAMRVPGSRKSLLQAKAQGADIRMVYSPLDALAIARDNPESEVVFFALGFETTMPSTALTLQQAKQESLPNFSILCHHVTTPPTLLQILNDSQLQLDGFIAPGHVAMIIGEEPFHFVAQDYHKPLVISGFEPLDVLQSLLMLLCQVRQGRSEVENQYRRVARAQGNAIAKAAVYDVFDLGEQVTLQDSFQHFDALRKFQVNLDPGACADPVYCGEVLRGRMRPTQCPLYGKTCTPSAPKGALMVSSEGACAAYHQHGKAVLKEV